jgi:hypothetical protein
MPRPSRSASTATAVSPPSSDASAPACGRCRQRLQTLTREAAALPLAPLSTGASFPDREKFDPMIGAWLFVGAAEREALLVHVLAFVHKSAAPRVVTPVRPLLRMLPGGRARRRAARAGGAR